MKIFGALSGLFLTTLSGLAFLGALALFLIILGGGILGLSFISLHLFPLPVLVEIWEKSEWLWQALEVSTDLQKAGALVVITLVAMFSFCLACAVFTSSRTLAAKLLPMLDE